MMSRGLKARSMPVLRHSHRGRIQTISVSGSKFGEEKADTDSDPDPDPDRLKRQSVGRSHDSVGVTLIQRLRTVQIIYRRALSFPPF